MPRDKQGYRRVRYTFAVLGGMAVEGDVLAWVSDHWKHHQFSDPEGDPHSPHVGFGDGRVAELGGCGMPTPAGSSRRPGAPCSRATRRTCCATAACA
ncbi:MAG: hypothetical protein QOF45_762 [Gaiellaceae bacterium]|nr:hypothetical protein [Gaiellaceae bacterium]